MNEGDETYILILSLHLRMDIIFIDLLKERIEMGDFLLQKLGILQSPLITGEQLKRSWHLPDINERIDYFLLK